MRTPRRTLGTGISPAPPTTAARGRRAHAGPPADERDDPPAASDEARVPAAGTQRRRWRLRPRTVRAKIISLLMVPVVSLLALWGFATVTTAQDVARLRQSQRVDQLVRAPVAAAIARLQDERRAAVQQVAAPDAERGAALRQQAARTDDAVAALSLDSGHTVAEGGDLPAGVADRLERFVAAVRKLRALRADVLDGVADWDATYQQYTSTIATAFTIAGGLTGIQDAELGSDARVLYEFTRAGEMLSREEALLASAQLTGTLSGSRLRLFAGAVETRRTLTDSAAADLPGSQGAAWHDFTRSGVYAVLGNTEDKVLAASPGRNAAVAVPAATWEQTRAGVEKGMRAIESGAVRSAAERADPFTRGALTPAGAAVLLGLVAVAASLVISVRIGRGLVVELVTLRNSALAIARRKLPRAMRRLRAGEELDILAEAPAGPPAQDEIGQVGEALTTVHRAALGAAVERAELASGISGVFVNLARRSQVLVHRQLNLLDSMERRVDDPNELGDLFRLDHLTTRMRRHAESLIILSGAAPGRAWRTPVPLTNVVRAAISEIEDYARVEVRHFPDTAVTGSAVADLTHLLAELIENAAQFSPPHTKVRINGEPVGNGYVLEIEDRGLGMGPEALKQANLRIEQSEALDLFDSDRLGLFVVSRLSARHAVRVHLRTSPYGGTTAVVLLPTGLLKTTANESGDAAPSRAQVPAPASRAAEEPPWAVQPAQPARTAPPGPPRPPSHPVLPEQLPQHEQPVPAGVTALRDRMRPPPQGSIGRVTDDTDDENTERGGAPAGRLPRRVRGAGLAPQLRGAPAPETPSSGDREGAAERTPEQVRDRMTAYLSGWARGGGTPAGKSSEGDHA
ncbi:nitrate- and nitrite sensing domain-containing protein [Streptomyces sannanensis]|uniref:histidine kinase n=1 Tax=Streptomyces sannanensis TaxID=285536 RepID=A0ABP6SMP1_9ACTN